MRLYRGLKGPYRSDRVAGDRLSGTDFTDCPTTALRYAEGSRGHLLVLEVAEQERAALRVTEELWLNGRATRYMVWGKFDACIVAAIRAKDLRAQLQREGMRSAPDASKAWILRIAIDEEIQRRASSSTTMTPEFAS
jgi:hypothetical protein